ncbi:MAG: hypothetical protein JO345_18980, partial [Streptosporangiaceae bacterium]|nr:hypothetical protein [Streptosporangiaceae bacterium]
MAMQSGRAGLDSGTEDPARETVSADPVREAAAAAAAEAERTGGLGRPGRAMNRHSPFFIGMTAAAGVAVTYGLVELITKARSVLILVGVAFFLAAGLDPIVRWLCRHRWPRWAAVLVTITGVIVVIGGF